MQADSRTHLKKGKALMYLWRVYKNCLIPICLGAFLVACQNNIFKEALTFSSESLKDRQLQTRIFEDIDEEKLLTACAAVLQDLGYTIDETEVKVGVIMCSRDRDVSVTAEVVLAVTLEILSILVGSPTSVPYDKTQKVLASLVTTPLGKQSAAVRIIFHHIVWNSDGKITKNEQINDPQIYQEFFSRLSKSVFLVAHEI
jgi:exosortase/archaeosortase